MSKRKIDPMHFSLKYTWRRMNDVCYKVNDPRYPRYGGRGIRCLWMSFDEFLKDMYQPYIKHFNTHGRSNTTIERINNDGDYCKENCKWATRKEQARNRCNRVEVTFNGETRSVKEWAEKIGCSHVSLWLRLFRRDWSIERALTTPFKKV